MCGCRSAFTSVGLHDARCECSCHNGVITLNERCWVRGPGDHRCRRAKDHAGDHMDKAPPGVGWVEAMSLPEKTSDVPGIRPDHYGGPDNPYECIKVIHAWDLGFDLGNVVKYVNRAGKKPDNLALIDLKKAQTYLQFAIDQIDKAGG